MAVPAAVAAQDAPPEGSCVVQTDDGPRWCWPVEPVNRGEICYCGQLQGTGR